MAALSDENRRDLESIERLLRTISAFLAWLVLESRFVPADILGAFLEVLPIAQSRLSAAASQLASVDDTEHQIWRRLDDAGMVGAPLRLKITIWNRLVESASAPTTDRGGFLGRALRPLVKMVNSLLGSLAAAFPALELVKEYKDGVEVVIEDQRRGTPPPGSILNLR